MLQRSTISRRRHRLMPDPRGYLADRGLADYVEPPPPIEPFAIDPLSGRVIAGGSQEVPAEQPAVLPPDYEARRQALGMALYRPVQGEDVLATARAYHAFLMAAEPAAKEKVFTDE